MGCMSLNSLVRWLPVRVLSQTGGCLLAGVAVCAGLMGCQSSTGSSISLTANTSTAPLVEQSADPWVYLHTDGYYYFIATAPKFDRIDIRRSTTIAGLSQAEPKTVWHKNDAGSMSANIWAPELHYLEGTWYIYVAAATSHTEPWRIRMHALSNTAANPMTGTWVEEGRVRTPIDSFSLDATTFTHKGKRYMVWAQQDQAATYNSALLIAEMDSPTSIVEPVVTISEPTLPWEEIGYRVNEGAAVLKRNGRLFITYSASATDHNYAMGLLWADENADPLDPSVWKKSAQPVFYTNETHNRYGPGHNGFTVAEDGKTDVMVYHARPYKHLKGNALSDPNRHAHVRIIGWDENGFPDFRQEQAD